MTAVKKKQAKSRETTRVKFSNLEKMMFPAAGLTKGDLLDYYNQIAPRLLPHLKDRPVTIERLPDGLSKPNAPRFWQKNTPAYYPSWIPRIELPTEAGKPVVYSMVNDLETLLYFVNQGTITFHVYMSRVKNLEHPDYVVFDLDRSESTFGNVVKIATTLRDILKKHKIDSYPKTTGKSGLHVLVPWKQVAGYDAARDWAMSIAEQIVKAMPKIATTERYKDQRGKRVYIDVIQNALGHHAVPPYVIRAVPEATVSTPLLWKEVTANLNPKKFDTKTVLARMKKQKTDPMAPLVA
jgi:bifunctional non-homologous end joining protein LigD